jgi:hypothetical protein
MFFPKLNIHRIHKWMGLVAAAWLLVLGLTGFILDHRDTWRWLWQSGIATKWITEATHVKSQSTHIRLYQINSDKPEQQVTGGLTGLWWSPDSGKSWQPTRFAATNTSPMVTTVFYSVVNQLWIASDDGVWLSTDAGRTAQQIILAGYTVTALSQGVQDNEVIGVTDRSRVFKYNLTTKNISWPDLQPVTQSVLPTDISLSRYVRDIHYGRGIFEAPFSLLWNDYSGIAMFVLPVTGFLFYWLPKRWRKIKRQQNNVSHTYKKHSMRWIFRLHGPGFGLLASIPLIYLSVTGILLDHGSELRQWMNSLNVTQSWQTPVYRFNSWKNEIYGVVSYSEQVEKFSIATRLGLFTTHNNGSRWVREQTLGDKALFVWTVRKFKNAIYLGGMGGPNMARQGNQPWHVAKDSGHMPTDITLDGQSNVIWKSRHGILSPGLNSTHHLKLNFPTLTYVPWFYVIDGLHTGLLIHSQWKWINDLVAVLAIFLVITGLLRWWRKKWI